MKNYPKLFYEKEDKPLHKIGYTLALALMGVGALETARSIPHIIKGHSDIEEATLGPLGIVTGGIVAYSYLREAKVIY